MLDVDVVREDADVLGEERTSQGGESVQGEAAAGDDVGGIAAAAAAGENRGDGALVELAGGGAVHQPAGQATTFDQIARCRRQAFAIKAARALAALAVRIVNDGDGRVEQRLVIVIEQEARPAGNRSARHRPQEMADQCAANPWIEHHRQLPAGKRTRIEPRHRAFTCQFADRHWIGQV